MTLWTIAFSGWKSTSPLYTSPAWYACDTSEKRTLVMTCPDWILLTVLNRPASEGKDTILAITIS